MQTGFLATYRTVVKAPVEKVWEALTNADLVKQYFFGSVQETDWQVGGPIIWRGEYEGQTYEDRGTVLEFVPYKTLSFSYLSSWSNLPDEPENYLQVTYVLREIPEGTALEVTQSNYDEERAQHSAENWATVMEGMKQLVED